MLSSPSQSPRGNWAKEGTPQGGTMQNFWAMLIEGQNLWAMLIEGVCAGVYDGAGAWLLVQRKQTNAKRMSQTQWRPMKGLFFQKEPSFALRCTHCSFPRTPF